jgi:L-fuculose-phosphate aldolase
VTAAVDERAARIALVETAGRLDADGLNHDATGNLSVRIDDGILVTPSGIPARELRPEDGVVLLADGTPRDADGRVPTSEWRLHLAQYHRQGVGAVVHTHSLEATAAAAIGQPVPAVHYLVAAFGGVVLPVAPYATYGTAELADSVAATLGDRYRACLMANHGAVAVAATLEGAASRARDVEWLCGVWRRARELGDPVILDEAELERVRQQFKTYGQPR